MKNHKIISREKSGGFAVLYAVLVASVVAIGGLVLSNIIFKQLVLSGVGQSSQISYYAADVGRSCARYWDKNSSFGQVLGRFDDDGNQTGSYFDKGDTNSPIQIYCSDPVVPVTLSEDPATINVPDSGKWNFVIKNINDNSCALVTVSNDINKFKFTSIGYNNPECKSNNRLVLRRVQDSVAH